MPSCQCLYCDCPSRVYGENDYICRACLAGFHFAGHNDPEKEIEVDWND